MSAKIMGKVWELELSPAKQTVLLALADHADHDGGNIFPTVALVAWKTGYSERQVRRIMSDLEEDGLLIRVNETKGKAVLYRLDLEHGKRKADFVPSKEFHTRKTRRSSFEDHRFGIMMSIAAHDGLICHYCGIALSEPSNPSPTMPTLDHKVAQKNGGSDEITNLVLCCSGCNSRKGKNFTYEQYREQTRREREARQNVPPGTDKMSHPTGGQDDIGHLDDGTSHGKQEVQTPDIASAKTASNRHKDQPSVEQEQEKAVVVAAPEILFKPQNFVSSQEPLPETPRVYAVFVENMRQQVTPLIADALKDAVAEFGDAWVEDAIREAVLNNVPKWVYAAAILDRWQREGRVETRPLARSSANGNEFDAPAESDGRRYVSGKYADFIEH